MRVIPDSSRFSHPAGQPSGRVAVRTFGSWRGYGYLYAVT